MAKANSPVRLEQTLMQQAKLAGSLHNRTAIEQIEYWASLGRNIAQVLDPETLIRVKSGLAKIRVECTDSQAIDATQVFADLDKQRSSGALAQSVTSTPFVYRASRTHEGQLERVDANGQVTVGQFSNGEFIAR